MSGQLHVTHHFFWEENEDKMIPVNKVTDSVGRGNSIQTVAVYICTMYRSDNMLHIYIFHTYMMQCHG
jgi:hypothetical protein